MNLWTAILTCPRNPSCPICTCDLIPDTTRVRWGIMLCSLCDQNVTDIQMRAVVRMLKNRTENGDVSSAMGITAWTPKHPWQIRTSPIIPYLHPMQHCTYDVAATLPPV